MALQVGELFATLNLSTKSFNNSLASAKSRFASFGQSVMSASGLMGGAGGQISAVTEGLGGLVGISGGAALGIGAVAAAISGIGVMSSKAIGEMQQVQMGFETLMGSASSAKAHIEELKDFAASTPFEMPQLAKASAQLQNVGFTAEQVLPMMQRIGDAAAATGGGDAMVGRLTVILGQIKSKQKVQAEEMMQLTEAGIPAWQLLADAIGTSVPEAMEKVKAGTISADGAIRAMLEGMDAKFGGLMAKQAETIPGLWSTLKDTMGEVLRNIGEVLLPIVTKGLKLLIGYLSGIAEMWKNFGSHGTTALSAIKPILDPIIVTLKNIWEGLKPIIIALGKTIITNLQILWAVAKPVFTLLFNAIKQLSMPLKWVLQLIGKLIEGINWLITLLKKLLKIKDIKMPELKGDEEMKLPERLEMVGMPASYFQEPPEAEEKAEKEAEKEAEKKRQSEQKLALAEAKEVAEKEAKAHESVLKKMEADRKKALDERRKAENKAARDRENAVKKAAEEEKRQEQEQLSFAGKVLAKWKEQRDAGVKAAEAAVGRIKSVQLGSLWEGAIVAAEQAASMTPPKVSGEQQPTVSELRKIAATLLRQEQMERQQLQITADRLGTFA